MLMLWELFTYAANGMLAFFNGETSSIGEVNNNAIWKEKEPGGAVFLLDRNVPLYNISDFWVTPFG